MPSSLDRQVRERLLDYLSGTTTVDQFKDWLISVTWNRQDGVDSAAMELSYEVHLAMADQSSGLTTEDELREALSELVHAVR